MAQAKEEVPLQFSESCAAEVALQHLLFCSVDVISTKSCAAASEKLQCNIEKTTLQESGAFLPLSCGFQAPTFRHPRLGPADSRERKMRTNFFCTNFLNTPRGPGHPGKIPRTSQTPLFETQGRPTFEGGHELFDPHPFAWKTPTPPGGLRTQKVNLSALFSHLRFMWYCASIADTPLARRGIAPQVRMLGGGVSHRIDLFFIERHQEPHSAQWGGISAQ